MEVQYLEGCIHTVLNSILLGPHNFVSNTKGFHYSDLVVPNLYNIQRERESYNLFLA